MSTCTSLTSTVKPSLSFCDTFSGQSYTCGGTINTINTSFNISITGGTTRQIRITSDPTNIGSTTTTSLSVSVNCGGTNVFGATITNVNVSGTVVVDITLTIT